MTNDEVDSSVKSDSIEEKVDSNETITLLATTMQSTSYPVPPSPCHCGTSERLGQDRLIIKEATTGYITNGQESGSFVTYVIEIGDRRTRKRYSDFELLSAHLNRIYLQQVIPPIPEKETLTSIISGYTGLKDRHDPFLIQHRIRLFQSFLLNIQEHPILRHDHYFHRFIDSELEGITWSEGIASIPSDASTTSSSISGCKVPDPLVARLEEMTHKYRDGIKSIERGQAKLLKRLKDESNDLSELGASFNGFSLELSDSLANQSGSKEKSTNQNEASQGTFANESGDFLKRLEMIGQSSDSEVIHLHSLIRHHELLRDRLQEIILFCGSILKALSNLSQKRSQLEDFHDQINGRKNVLMQMESTVRADESETENLTKLKKLIEELENSKKLKMTEMSEFTAALLKDIDRTFAYFGRTWKSALKALAGCQSQWHEEAIKTWST